MGGWERPGTATMGPAHRESETIWGHLQAFFSTCDGVTHAPQHTGLERIPETSDKDGGEESFSR